MRHASFCCLGPVHHRKAEAEVTSCDQTCPERLAIAPIVAREANALPRQSIQIDVATRENNTYALAADVDLSLLNRGKRNCR
jgi:hypothetical protein